MYTCIICRFEAELDNAITSIAIGCCICLRCFSREAQPALAMPKDLRRQIVTILDEASTASAA